MMVHSRKMSQRPRVQRKRLTSALVRRPSMRKAPVPARKKKTGAQKCVIQRVKNIAGFVSARSSGSNVTPEKRTPLVNEFSGPSYRVVNFVADLPVRMDKHIAMFPVELPRRLILMYSFWGETVLDPFLGSGTTLIAAQTTGRTCIGLKIDDS